MPEIGTFGLMSGDGKRGVGHRPQATAPILDSTTPTDVATQANIGFRGHCGSGASAFKATLMTHMRHQPPVFTVTHNAFGGVVNCSVRLRRTLRRQDFITLAGSAAVARPCWVPRCITWKEQIMTAFNAVRFKVKVGANSNSSTPTTRLRPPGPGLSAPTSSRPASVPSALSPNGPTWMRLLTHAPA